MSYLYTFKIAEGREIKNISYIGFNDLGDGYATCTYHVYYNGVIIKEASCLNFCVSCKYDGYAKDAFNIYYKGIKI